ncbi:MAG TPA: alginate export family protein [Fimbriimonas sp.]|nr:alginate export family protein [Fimbriimonas sp.]
MIFQIPTDYVSIKPYVDLRERYERHINRKFVSSADDSRSDMLTRFRVGLDLGAQKYGLTGKIEYQYAHDWFWMQPQNGSARNSDLSLGWLRYQAPDKSWWAQAGRQKIAIGQQRLIGMAEWTTLGRSFDALRVGHGQWDIWGGKLGVATVKPETARVAALTHTDPKWGQGSIIYKHDVAPKGKIDIETLDYVADYPIWTGKLDGEGALQFGNDNGKTQQAWAYHIRYTLPILPKTTASIEYNAASGGSTSDTNRTFDSLFPTNHDLYGLSDLSVWRNLNDLAFTVQTDAVKNLTLKGEYHIQSLRDASDGWYGSNGINPRVGGSFVDPTGKSGRDLGNEVDLLGIYKTKNLGTFQAGIAFFNPGDFIKSFTGHANQQIYGFLQYQVLFK